jgi:hypothetical protein
MNNWEQHKILMNWPLIAHTDNPENNTNINAKNISISSLHASVASYWLLQLLVTDNTVPSSMILFTLMMEATWSSETSVLTTATWHHVPEDDILHSHNRETLKSYKIMADHKACETKSRRRKHIKTASHWNTREFDHLIPWVTSNTQRQNKI